MAFLTEEQRQFLFRYNIPLSDVFDASGFNRVAVYQAKMKELGIGFAFGTSPCQRGGHTLRTRKGHCIQCSPANISYFNRFRENGYVYIAQSRSTARIKVGMTTDLLERGRQLNIYSYGGVRDWQISATAWTNRAGEVECKTQDRLKNYAVLANYFKAGDQIDCREIFSCSFEIAKAALLKSIPAGTKLNLL